MNKEINELKSHLDTMIGNSSQLKAEKLVKLGYRRQIVRCKDCEYAYMYGDRVYCRNIQTPWYNDYFEVFTKADDFCSYAEMKGGAE